MSQDKKMPGFDPFGVFIEENSHRVGDPYLDISEDKNYGKLKGKQFVIVSNTLRDEPISKAIPTLDKGDPFQDKQAKASTGKSSNKPPFKPSNPTKEQSGKGDTYGSFGPFIFQQQQPQETTKEHLDKMKNTKTKKQIYTSGAKQGGPGYPEQDRTIGGTKFEYRPDAYNYGYTLSQKCKKEARKKINAPFKSSFASKVELSPRKYLDFGPAMERKSHVISNQNQKLWKPSNPGRQGRAYCSMSRVGLEYVPQGNQKLQAPTQKNAEGTASSKKPFKPNYFDKQRLSMWTVNPYQYAPRESPNLDFTYID